MAKIKEDVAKILILGDSRVGKSSILARYCDGTFTEIMTTTIGRFSLKKSFSSWFSTIRDWLSSQARQACWR